MLLITILFIIVLILIIVIANLGLGPTFFPFMYEISGADKVGHFLLIGILTFLVNIVLNRKMVKLLSRNVLLGSMIIMVIVTIEEFSQIFLQYRAFSLIDLLFDYLGIFVFGYLTRLVKQQSKNT